MSDDAPDAAPSAVDWLLRPRGGWPQLPAGASVFLSLALSLFPLYSTDFGQTEAHAHRSTHLAFMLVLTSLFFPPGRTHFSDPVGWPFLVDLACIAVAIGAQVYTLVHPSRFVDPGSAATTGDIVV